MENAQQTQKRPVGMTILLVLSFINAIWNILASVIMFFATPKLESSLESSQFEAIAQSLSEQNEDVLLAFKDNITALSQINPYHYLILFVLFIASLIGVIKMLKMEKHGLHIYAIAQILMLISSSIFIYPLQKSSSFLTDLLLTAMFIVVYYLYFKRMDIQQNQPNDPNIPLE